MRQPLILRVFAVVLITMPGIVEVKNEILKSTVSSNDKKTKGRTGWPQHVWALELKQ